MKFLHAADIHLDSPMMGVSRKSEAPLAALQDCTRRAFSNLVELAIAEDVDFLLISGDLYDQDWKDYGTGLFFAREMVRLGRPCFVILGNHDASSQITRGLRLSRPANVHLFPDQHCTTVTLRHLGVAIHGQSFAERSVPEDLSARYCERQPGLINIGMLHTSADGRPGHDPYAPCTAAGLALRGYDYWALGHIHAREVLGEYPHIVFPGNLQGRSIREPGPKGCTLVHVENDRIAHVEHRTVDVLRWAHEEVDVDGATSLPVVAARVRDVLERLADAAEGRQVAARLTLVGETPVHRTLAADLSLAYTECLQAAGTLTSVWIEALKPRTRAPASEERAQGGLAELRRSFLEATTDDAFRGELLAELAAMLKRFPDTALDEETRALATVDGLAGLVSQGWDIVHQGLAAWRDDR